MKLLRISKSASFGLLFTLFLGIHLVLIRREISLCATPCPHARAIKPRRVPLDLMPQSRALIVRFNRVAKPETPQDDPDLVSFIRDEILEERRHNVPKLSYPLYQTPQAAVVNDILKNKSDGFFVECGAFDGERSSNTIWLEHQLQWRGLLVEMDPSYYLQLRGKNRNSYTANACLSPEPYPLTLPFVDMQGGDGVITRRRTKQPTVDAICLPFFSIMLAMNVTHIDYFSLDVEGQEFAVLKTIPFDKIDISVISVEYLHTKKVAMRKFMEGKGYTTAKTLEFSNPAISQWSYDYIFVKNR
ncbi:hypothetical protein CAPTEDRAFT_215618 [Capitella teleta]|uniref:Methyltransferase FkbM domain-containing protein n=1 Tax=Capitella teleta TaxID=283909 RepID=R7UWT0_CAPTE|nr:hypothetical protein CAPTEDRAFT_215618 [Capitella teleta]|eukprot:ELU11063.1 hypothetical protein CAPTEDRAFT_215618 [Capitella teleta]